MLKLIGDLQRSSQRTAAGSTMNRIGRRMILCMLLMAALVIIWNSSYLAASRQKWCDVGLITAPRRFRWRK